MAHMNRLGLVLLIALAVLPRLAMAETIDLVCSHEQNGFSFRFTIDTSAQSVVSNGKPARKVLVDDRSITFTLDLVDGAYFHAIDRSTGTLTVRAPNGVLIHGHRCVPPKPKP